MRSVFKDFFYQYGKGYQKPDLYNLTTNIENMLNKGLKPDDFEQIYAYTKTIEDRDNIYLDYLRLLLENQDINCNILEIGGGKFPTFATYLKQAQGEFGSITIYDSKLITTDIPNLKLVREDFKIDTSIDEYDLIIGIRPCQATTLIIKRCIEENKRFFLATCGCTHFSKEQRSKIPPTLYNWNCYLESLMDFENQDIKKLKLGPRFPFYPIYSKNK